METDFSTAASAVSVATFSATSFSPLLNIFLNILSPAPFADLSIISPAIPSVTSFATTLERPNPVRNTLPRLTLFIAYNNAILVIPLALDTSKA